MQERACSSAVTREHARHLWVTSDVEGSSVLKCRILPEEHQVKLKERLMKSTSCGDEKGNGTRTNGKS